MFVCTACDTLQIPLHVLHCSLSIHHLACSKYYWHAAKVAKVWLRSACRHPQRYRHQHGVAWPKPQGHRQKRTPLKKTQLLPKHGEALANGRCVLLRYYLDQTWGWTEQRASSCWIFLFCLSRSSYASCSIPESLYCAHLLPLICKSSSPDFEHTFARLCLQTVASRWQE